MENILPLSSVIKPNNQDRVQSKDWTCLGRRRLRYLFKTREPILKDDSDATVVIGMLSMSYAI